eukprot:scaffold51205_cov36-Phaeocystis_antarctica.AAC.1
MGLANKHYKGWDGLGPQSSSGGHSKMSPNLNARGLGLGETPLGRWGGYRGLFMHSFLRASSEVRSAGLWLRDLHKRVGHHPLTPLTPHKAGGRRPSNGGQGAGQQVRPPGTEHSPRDDLAAHEVQHLNHL